MKEVLECPEIKGMNLPQSFTETLLVGKDRVHLMDKITRYLNQHLKP